MSDEDEGEFWRWTEGLFVGQLDAAEMDAFTRLVTDGKARWSYEGAAGMMGLAKVRRAHSGSYTLNDETRMR